MDSIPTPFGRTITDDSTADGFDAYDSFIPAGVPEPGPFLRKCEILAGTEHAAFHRLSKRLFEDRGVYDVTFGYNLARLNLDRRHPGAGYRYAVESDSERGDDNQRPVLRAEFTPTTPFCPQSKSLTIGSYRAWNGESERHEYELIRVRVHPMHHRSESINEELAALEPEWPVDVDFDDESETPDTHTEVLRDRVAESDDETTSSGSDHGVDLSQPF